MAAKVAALKELKARAPHLTQKDWAASAKVKESTLCDYLAGKPKLAMKDEVLHALAAVKGMTAKEWEDLVAAKLAGPPALGFKGELLPTMLVPATPDGFLLKYAAQSLAATRSEALSDAAAGDGPVNMVLLVRSLDALRTNLVTTHGGSPVHPLVTTPFTYVGVSFALSQQEKLKEQGGSGLLVLDDFAMERMPATFAVVGRGREEQPTAESIFHREVRELGDLEAAKNLARRLDGMRILHDAPAARSFLASAFAHMRRLGVALPNCELIKIHDVASALQMLDLGILPADCLLMAWHSHVWAIRGRRTSTLQILVSNDPGAPAELMHIRPFRVIVTPKGLLSVAELDMAARWLIHVSRKLKSRWRLLFQQCLSFLNEEMGRYGVPGIAYSPETVERLIDEGLRLHLPDEARTNGNNGQAARMPLFVDLTEEWAKRLDHRGGEAGPATARHLEL